MTNRKDKRTKSYRGLGSHGAGNAKNRRGSGNRGGVGHAGLNKHKKTWMVKYAPDYFGNHGFVNPTKEELKVLNVFDIENLARKGSLEKRGTALHFTFEGKILGSGEIISPVNVQALGWSKKAEEKIKQAGGALSKLERPGKKEKAAKGQPAEKTGKKAA
ncbi:MAG: uL15 family ribosomal protein [Candidatus Micrarchaeia archaeon]